MSYQIGAIDNTTNTVENILHNLKKKATLGEWDDADSLKSIIQESNPRRQ